MIDKTVVFVQRHLSSNLELAVENLNRHLMFNNFWLTQQKDQVADSLQKVYILRVASKRFGDYSSEYQ